MKGVYVMLTFGGGDMPIRAIESIFHRDGEKVDIILVDNGSAFSYSDYLERKLAVYGFQHIWEDDFRFRLDRLKANLSSPLRLIFSLNRNRLFSGGMRWGVKLAYALGYDFAILANDDIEVLGEVYSGIKSTFERYENVVIVVPYILLGKTKEPLYVEKCPEIDWPMLKIWYLWFGHKVAHKLCGCEEEIDGPSDCFAIKFTHGSFFGIRLWPLRRIGFYPYRYFLAGEEPEIEEKLRKLGYKTVYCKNIGPVWHLESVTVGKHKKSYLWGDLEYISRLYGVSRRGILLFYLMSMFFYSYGLTPKAWVERISSTRCRNVVRYLINLFLGGDI